LGGEGAADKAVGKHGVAADGFFDWLEQEPNAGGNRRCSALGRPKWPG